MNPLWNDAVLRSLKEAATRQNPAGSWVAECQRQRDWLARTRNAAAGFAAVLVAVLCCVCLGLLTRGSDAPLEACAGFSAANLCLAALLLSGALGRAVAWRPESQALLSLAPAEPSLAGRLAHCGIKKRLLRPAVLSIAGAALVVAGCGFASLQAGLPFHWLLVGPAALVLWVQLLALACALQSLPTLLSWVPQGLRRILRYPGMALLIIPVLGAMFGPLGLNCGPDSLPVQTGLLLHHFLPPARLLLWPAAGTSPAWQDLAITGALVVLALPNLRQLVQAWRTPPFIPPVPWGSGRSEIHAFRDQDDEGADEESAGEVPAEPRPRRTFPTVPDAATPQALRDLAARVREKIDDPRLRPDRFLLPDLPSWRELLGPIRRHLLWTVGLAALGAMSGHCLGILSAWLWITIRSHQGLGTLLWFPAFWRLPLGQAFLVPIHGWLPVEMHRAWERASLHTLRQLGTSLGAALLLPAAGWLTSLALAPVGRLWNWESEKYVHLLPHEPAVVCALVLAGICLAKRILAASNFAGYMNQHHFFAGPWRWFTALPTLHLLLALAALLGSGGCLLLVTLDTATRADLHTFPLPFLTLASAGLLAASEGLLQTIIWLTFYQWSRGRRR